MTPTCSSSLSRYVSSVREMPGTVSDLAEGRRTEQQIAKDDGSPPLGEYLRGPRNGAILAIRPHGP